MSGRYKAVPETTNNRRLAYVVIDTLTGERMHVYDCFLWAEHKAEEMNKEWSPCTTCAFSDMDKSYYACMECDDRSYKKMSMENMDIRLMVDEHNIKHKDIAKKIGISPQYLSTQMRYPLPPVMRERIIRAIESLREDIKGPDTRETQIRTVEAIPVDYIRNKASNATGAESTYLRKLLNDWERKNDSSE